MLVIYVPRLYDAQRFTDTVLTKGAKTWFGRERWRSTSQPRRSLRLGKVDEAVHRTKGLQLVSKSLSPDQPDHWLGTIDYDMRKCLVDGLESNQWASGTGWALNYCPPRQSKVPRYSCTLALFLHQQVQEEEAIPSSQRKSDCL